MDELRWNVKKKRGKRTVFYVKVCGVSSENMTQLTVTSYSNPSHASGCRGAEEEEPRTCQK